MGLTLSNPATTVNSKLLVTKSNTAGDAVLGTASVTMSASPSSWGQVTASLSAESVVTQVSVTQGTGSFTLTSSQSVEIAIGGAGSEVVKATIPLTVNYNAASTRTAVGVLGAPLRIATGQRIAARFTDSNSGAGVDIAVYGVAYANLEGN